MHFTDILKGTLLIALAAVIWGTAGTTQTFLAGSGLSASWLGVFRLLIASAFFALLYWFREGRKRVPSLGTSVLFPALGAGIFIGLYNLCFFAGLRLAGVGIGTVLDIGSSPVWAGLIGILVTRRLPRTLWIIGTVIAIAGGTLVSLPGGEADAESLTFLAVALCLGAGLFNASYAWCSKFLLEKVSPLLAVTLSFTVAFLTVLPAATLIDGAPVVAAGMLPAVVGVSLWLGLVVTGIAYLLFTDGLRLVPPATSVAVMLIEPATAWILAVLVVGESFSWQGLVGLVILLAGLGFLIASDAKNA